MWQYNYTNPDELYHYGIMGMKWGVRRYQNEDGSLTAAGKSRYLKDNGKLNSKGAAAARNLNPAAVSNAISSKSKKTEADMEYVRKTQRNAKASGYAALGSSFGGYAGAMGSGAAVASGAIGIGTAVSLGTAAVAASVAVPVVAVAAGKLANNKAGRDYIKSCIDTYGDDYVNDILSLSSSNSYTTTRAHTNG